MLCRLVRLGHDCWWPPRCRYREGEEEECERREGFKEEVSDVRDGMVKRGGIQWILWAISYEWWVTVMPTTRLRLEDWLLCLHCIHHSTSTHWRMSTVTTIVVTNVHRLIEDSLLWLYCRRYKDLLLALNDVLYTPQRIPLSRYWYAFSTSYTIPSFLLYYLKPSITTQLPYHLISLISTNRLKTSTDRESPSPSPLQSDPPSLCATFTKRRYDFRGSEPSYKTRT